MPEEPKLYNVYIRTKSPNKALGMMKMFTGTPEEARDEAIVLFKSYNPRWEDQELSATAVEIREE